QAGPHEGNGLAFFLDADPQPKDKADGHRHEPGQAGHPHQEKRHGFRAYRHRRLSRLRTVRNRQNKATEAYRTSCRVSTRPRLKLRSKWSGTVKKNSTWYSVVPVSISGRQKPATMKTSPMNRDKRAATI